MTRTERLLRLARLRGDRLAVATLEAAQRPFNDRPYWPAIGQAASRREAMEWSEAELRAAWGDR